MGLYGDHNQPALWRQVFGTAASGEQALAGGKPPAKSALSQARARLGPRPLRHLFRNAARPPALPASRDTPASGLYKGRRVLALDGQQLAIPDTPANAAAFGRHSTTRDGVRIDAGYPQIHTLRLIETGTRMNIEAIIKPCKHAEYPCAASLLRKANRDDLILADACFYGYSLLKTALDTGRHMLVRVSSTPKFNERQATLPDGSYLAAIRPQGTGRSNPANIRTVRVIHYTINDPDRPGHQKSHRLVTTLLDPARYPMLELIMLYHERWEIEIANDEIKTHLLARKVPLRSKTPRGLVQEFYGIMLTYNAIRLIIHEAAAKAEVPPRRLSFLNSVRLIRETVPLMRAAPTHRLQRIYEGMLTQIALEKLPEPDGRINPRVVKVKMSKFRKKRPTDVKPKQPRYAFKDSVVSLN